MVGCCRGQYGVFHVRSQDVDEVSFLTNGLLEYWDAQLVGIPSHALFHRQ